MTKRRCSNSIDSKPIAAIDEDARVALAAHEEIDNSERYTHIEGFIWTLCLGTQPLFPVTQAGKQPGKEIVS